MFLAVSIVFAILVVNALFPVRREPFTVASFAMGWIPGELPLHAGALELACLVAFGLNGAFDSWPGWVALAVTVGTCAGFVRLAVVAGHSKVLVDEALDQATGGAISAADLDLRPAWNHWWRLVIAVPFRLRGIRRARNIDYWGDGNYRHKLDILTRRSVVPEGAPVLIYIHGGAWTIGDKRQQGIPMMHELVQRGWVCVAINYRLSPRATWPAHIVDCKRAVAWVRQHIAEYGGDPGFIAVSGGSAGGHLCSLLALTPDEPEWQPGFEELDASVDACVPFYGVYDMTGHPDRSGAYGDGTLDLLERLVMKTTIADNPRLFEEASPDHRVTPAAPPMLVFHGTNDTLVPLAVARYFVAQLQLVSEAPVAYVELPKAQHAFEVLASIRSRHTTMGAVRFLEGVRMRVER
ncbi:MAG: alpha/beta hydrolase [Acidimicrobiales bacterium]